MSCLSLSIYINKKQNKQKKYSNLSNQITNSGKFGVLMVKHKHNLKYQYNTN